MKAKRLIGLLSVLCACAPAPAPDEASAGMGGTTGAPVWAMTGGAGGMNPPQGTGGNAGAAGDPASGGVGGNAGAAGDPAVGGTGGMDVSGTGGAAGGEPVVFMDECTPPTGSVVSDFGALGPFETEKILNTGPNGQYTMVRPKTPGLDGFKHPPVSWGNGITTTPDAYKILLDTVASHGFVVIASNSTNVNATLVRDGLDWLIAQNTAAGPLQGTLAVDCAATIGYSLGGGASIGAGAHPNVKATVSLHGLEAASENLSGPLLLLTSTDDGFVTKAGYTVPTYNRSSKVPTIMGTLDTGRSPPDTTGHLIPLNDAKQERAPLVAWLRYWIYGDQGARGWFFGNDCTLCQAPWTDIQRKNHGWD